MLRHEFVLARFDEIEHGISYKTINRTNEIIVPDSSIVNSRAFLTGFISHWDIWGNPHCGLNYHGISIISAEHISEFEQSISRVRFRRGVRKLLHLCEKAKKENLFIVHIGI